MVKPRIPETCHGIHGEFDVEVFNRFAKIMRDKGWIETEQMISVGICAGNVLEIGPGPGIKGLEWLKNTADTKLTALEISPDMISVALKNAKEYDLEARVQYVYGNATTKIPFDNDTFDAVFSNSSLYAWDFPEQVFNEMYRVLKPGCTFFVSDLRRDMNPLVRTLIKMNTQPKEVRPGFISALNAAYTADEITDIIRRTKITRFEVKKDMIGLTIIGRK